MFSTVDTPSNRFLSIEAVDERSTVYAVDVPFGRFDHPDTLSNRFAARALVFPTAEGLQRLAEDVLSAQLVPTHRPPALSARLAHSQYAVIGTATGVARQRAALLAPFRSGTEALEVTKIAVRVLRFAFNPENDRATLEQVGPTGTARRDGHSP